MVFLQTLGYGHALFSVKTPAPQSAVAMRVPIWPEPYRPNLSRNRRGSAEQWPTPRSPGHWAPERGERPVWLQHGLDRLCGVLARHHRHELELDQAVPTAGPLLQQAGVLAFHELEAAVEIGLDTAADVGQAVRQ